MVIELCYNCLSPHVTDSIYFLNKPTQIFNEYGKIPYIILKKFYYCSKYYCLQKMKTDDDNDYEYLKKLKKDFKKVNSNRLHFYYPNHIGGSSVF